MSPALPPYVNALLKPEAYPDHPARVEMVQTQMSFVFLTGKYTYKTKKPVNLGYLDYTTLEKRLHFCRQELELNRRLCLGAYLDVLPITDSSEGIKVGGSGETIEYAVKMKQLPQDRMMDVLLKKDGVTPQMLSQVATLMSAFHSKAATNAEIGSYGSLPMIQTNTDENFSQTEKYIGVIIPERTFGVIKDYTNGFIRKNSQVFSRRVSEGRIRDCHGDLHAAHICFGDEIYIYDCIEFNDRFRYSDVASEIAFLAMDIDRYGRADLSNAFVEAYLKTSGDKGIAGLLDFYKCYRAYVRGKVACFKYDDPYIKDKDSTLAEAKLYFNLARKYADKRPVVIVVTGLIGSGKTTTATEVGRGLSYTVLSSDIIRKELAGVPATERHYDEFDKELYSPESTRKTYEEMFRRARGLLAVGRSVVLDASFKKRSDRLAAQELARSAGAGFLIIECTADDETIKGWLEDRQRKGSVSDGRWEIYADLKKEFEKVDKVTPANHLILDTNKSSGNIIPLILERISGL
ncbi:MAG: AAA family ATPase [Dehalococcoidia bacterium]|jgi:aminoglycoside phosphotransferase family enzyme